MLVALRNRKHLLLRLWVFKVLICLLAGCCLYSAEVLIRDPLEAELERLNAEKKCLLRKASRWSAQRHDLIQKKWTLEEEEARLKQKRD